VTWLLRIKEDLQPAVDKWLCTHSLESRSSSLADSCVSSGLVFWKDTEWFGKLGWSSPYTKKETGVNAPTTGAFLSPASLEKNMPSLLKKDATKNLNQSWKIPSAFFVPAVTIQKKISTLQQILRNLGSMLKTSPHVFPTSTNHTTGFLVKSFGSVVGVQCWRPPVTGRQVTVFLLSSLCPCRRS